MSHVLDGTLYAESQHRVFELEHEVMLLKKKLMVVLANDDEDGRQSAKRVIETDTKTESVVMKEQADTIRKLMEQVEFLNHKLA